SQLGTLGTVKMRLTLGQQPPDNRRLRLHGGGLKAPHDNEPEHKRNFLSGGGEMGARIRAFDWSSTPLGHTDEWPQSLRSAISILLPSPAQPFIFCAPELLSLPN